MTDGPGVTPSPGQPRSRPAPAHADAVRGNRLVLLVAIGALALLAVAAVVLALTLGGGKVSPTVSGVPRSLSALTAQ